MNKIIYFLCAVLMTTIGFAQGVETFEGVVLPAPAADGSFEGESGLTFDFKRSRDQAGFPITNNGLMLNNASQSYLEWTVPSGVGELSFDYRKAGDLDNPLQLEVIVNGVQVNTSDVYGNFTGVSDTIYTLTTPINVDGEATIRIKNVGSSSAKTRQTLDNISWTAFDAPEYYINFVETTGAFIDVTNATGNDGYADYTNDETKVVTISEGQPAWVQVAIENSGEPVNFGVWVDLNQDDTFGTAPMGENNTPTSGYEQIQTTGSLVGSQLNFIIPGVGLESGNEYVVRLQVKKSALSPNDTNFEDGETEDYLIRVLPTEDPDACEEPHNSDAANSEVYISNIHINGIGADLGDPTYDLDYTSNDMATDGYEVVTNPTLTIYPGLESAYSVSSGPEGNTNQYYYSVWIDVDQNGCFELTEQIIWSDFFIWGGGIPNGEIGSENVPFSFGELAPGTYQARIRNSLEFYPSAGGEGDGEALDFTIEVLSEGEAELVLGVDNQMFTDFTYYPNPVENQLNLHAGTPIEQVDVYNLLGQQVMQVKPNALEANLTTDQLQSGVYLMNVTIDGSQKTFRIVKR